MKSFKELSRTQKILTISAGLLAGVFFIGDDQENSSVETGGYPASENGAYTVNTPAGATSTTQTSYSKPMTSSGKVEIYDQGLQMPVGTYTLPEGWKIIQDIAINPSTNQPAKYKLDMIGPQGELIRALGTSRYGTMVGKSFEQGWRQLAMAGLQADFEQISFGSLQPDPQSQQRTLKNRVIQRALSQGAQLQCLQSPISGYRNGQMVKGMVFLTHMTFGSNMGTINAAVAIAPAGGFDQLMQVQASISDSYMVNPAYEQRREQIQAGVLGRIRSESDAMIASSRAAHQQRMADRWSSFNNHQENMKGMSQTQDASYHGYMDNLRNDNTSAWGNNNYTGHDASIDAIHGRSTYENPDTGFDVSLDGYYKYTYTNGLGQYHQTDDPNFDPNSLPGDWRLVEPRSSSY